MEENEILQNIKDAARDDLYFHSNRGKEDRERWVVSEFMRFLKIKFEESEINSLEQSSKTDVQFRDGKFQVKEITDPSIMRNKYFKNQYNSIKSANKLEDIELPTMVQDTPDVTRMYKLILLESRKLSESDVYTTTKNELDLIFYITRPRAVLINEDEINSQDFSNLGWRSISCLNTKQAVVLYASEGAPEFLKTKTKHIFKAYG
jgi:hypothetical protein